MKKFLITTMTLIAVTIIAYGQKAPTGNPKDFKVKTCLHSVGYSGAWRGQAVLSIDEFLVKAKELGFDGVMLGAKRPHVSLIDYDDAARQKLRTRIKELGLELVCIAGYNDFTAGVDKSGIPNVEIQAVYIGELARLARDLALIWSEYLPHMKEIGYQGYIAWEMCAELKGGGSVENLDKTAKAFLEYVKQFK
mgnify:CR=1 FL=1